MNDNDEVDPALRATYRETWETNPAALVGLALRWNDGCWRTELLTSDRTGNIQGRFDDGLDLDAVKATIERTFDARFGLTLEWSEQGDGSWVGIASPAVR